MIALKTQDQGTIVLSRQDYLPIIVDSFLIDRQAQGVASFDFSYPYAPLH